MQCTFGIVQNAKCAISRRTQCHAYLALCHYIRLFAELANAKCAKLICTFGIVQNAKCAIIWRTQCRAYLALCHYIRLFAELANAKCARLLCTFGIVHNAICVPPTTVGVADIAHLALSTMPNVPSTLQMASHTLHIWHCVECHLCHSHYSWGSRHCTFGIVHNAICVPPTTAGVADIAHLALCTMPFVSLPLQFG